MKHTLRRSNQYEAVPSLSRSTALVFFLLVAAFPFGAKAQGGNEEYSLRLNEAAVQRGYTVSHPSGALTVGLWPGVLDRAADVVIKPLPMDAKEPEGYVRVSPVYSFAMVSDPKITSTVKPFTIVQSYTSDRPYRKQLFFWNGIVQAWQPVPSTTDGANRRVRAFWHLPHARFAVFERNREREGIASWYPSSQKPYGAASNDFPTGTKLLVTNTVTGRSTTVTVVSTGPFVADRMIDLAKTAFGEISPTADGVVRVTVAPVEDIAAATSSAAPVVHASGPPPATRGQTAFVWRSDNDETLYEKQYRSRPIASLTKLMSAIVFAETVPAGEDWNRIVSYEASDDAEGSKLSVASGETLSINDLFFTMITGSANNAANALVRLSGLSREAFVARMNARAQSLEMHYTHFVDPTGLEPGNVSTPGDITKLLHYALKRPGIRTASLLPAYRFTTRNTEKLHTIRNTNTLLDDGLPLNGGKTGYLDEAGYGLAVELLSRDGKKIVVMTLGAPSQTARDADVLALSRWALAQT